LQSKMICFLNSRRRYFINCSKTYAHKSDRYILNRYVLDITFPLQKLKRYY